MKVVIKAGSQEEFDSKREELIKAIAGSKLNVKITSKEDGSMEDEGVPYYASQASMLEEWDRDFANTLKEIKREIGEVIGEG